MSFTFLLLNPTGIPRLFTSVLKTQKCATVTATVVFLKTSWNYFLCELTLCHKCCTIELDLRYSFKIHWLHQYRKLQQLHMDDQWWPSVYLISDHLTLTREETDVTTAPKKSSHLVNVLRFLWHFSTASLAWNVTVINSQLVKGVRKCQAVEGEGNGSV